MGRKTGYRWRAENGGLQPDYLTEASRSGRYLSLLERRRIASLRGRGLAIREMVGLLGRALSTVSRELRRNSRPHDYGRYDADLAHCAAANGPDVPDVPSCPWIPSSKQRCSPNWTWSGARSRSPVSHRQARCHRDPSTPTPMASVKAEQAQTPTPTQPGGKHPPRRPTRKRSTDFVGGPSRNFEAKRMGEYAPGRIAPVRKPSTPPL
ncbi:helix-turn-helix domain-containing protein [Streptomyces sp. NPDC001027]|uniref:helix-turn-helix domain-containing protein n=1 Tax=Streptomyces sp. NPDC001027 TaxID=3154771 RepID=UPI00332BF0E6